MEGIELLILAAIFLIIGVQFLIIGLVSDLIASNRRLIEETLLKVKKMDKPTKVPKKLR